MAGTSTPYGRRGGGPGYPAGYDRRGCHIKIYKSCPNPPRGLPGRGREFPITGWGNLVICEMPSGPWPPWPPDPAAIGADDDSFQPFRRVTAYRLFREQEH